MGLLFCAGFSIGVNAQNTFSKGDKVVNLGIGIGSTLGGSGYKTSIPPLSGSFELGIVDNLFNDKSSLGVGGYLGYSANKWSHSYGGESYGWKYSYIILGARGSFHYQLVDKLDTYAGIMLGYNISSSKAFGDWGYETGTASSYGGFIFSPYIGGRYYFTGNMAAFAELGYGIAYLQLGVSFKF